MTLRTWLIENRLKRVEAKLKKLRYKQKKLREDEDVLSRAKKAGLGPMEAKVREERLAIAKESVTAEVARMMQDEEALKAELRQEDEALLTH